jgi:hypothetical protein
VRVGEIVNNEVSALVMGGGGRVVKKQVKIIRYTPLVIEAKMPNRSSSQEKLGCVNTVLSLVNFKLLRCSVWYAVSAASAATSRVEISSARRFGSIWRIDCFHEDTSTASAAASSK